MANIAQKTQDLPVSPTRDLILRVATRLFARQGYDRVTMRDISAGAGYTLPTIYHHFKDKENLYREVELANYGMVRERLLAALDSDGSPRERLRTFIAEKFDILNEDAVFRSLALRNMMDPDGRHHKFLVSATLQDIYESLESVLAELGVGSRNKTLPLAIISSIFGFVAMEPAKRQIRGYPFSSSNGREEREQFIEYLLGSVLNA